MKIGELAELAQRIVSDESDPEKLSSLIEGYSAAFDRWTTESPILDHSRSDLERLMELHTAVLNRAQALLGKTSHDLKTLRSRAKGVVKYLDQNTGQSLRGKATKG